MSGRAECRVRRDWAAWDALFSQHEIVIDRPKGSAHPRYPEMIYPIDYGYLVGTVGGDGDPIDCFVGESDTGLIGMLETCDPVKGDREIKLLWNVTEAQAEELAVFLRRGGMSVGLMSREH